MDTAKQMDTIDSASAISNSSEPLLPAYNDTILTAAGAPHQADPQCQDIQNMLEDSPVVPSVAENEDRGPSSSDGTLSLVGIKISYDMTPFSSTLSSIHPVCRICQNAGEKNNVLLAPCRCDGSLKYVHGACLRRWIEMRLRRKRYEHPRNCELCGYLYKKRKFIKCTEWKMPRVSAKDKILHLLFIVCLLTMITCIVVTIQHLIYDASNGGAHKYRTTNGGRLSLSVTELITLTCGVVFFITFMVAVTVEIKARHTIYELIRKIIRHNTEWVIENYDRKLDKT